VLNEREAEMFELASNAQMHKSKDCYCVTSFVLQFESKETIPFRNN